jgi:MFS family permease
MVVGALMTPVFGRLGDGPRRREVILLVLAVVALGSVLAAIPGSPFVILLVGRGMQGVGFGLTPLTMAVARQSLRPVRSARAIAILSVASTGGVGIGYVITGVLDESVGLHGTFLFGALVSGVALLSSWWVLPESTQRSKQPLDIAGAALLGCALLSLLIAVSEASSWGWASAAVVTLLVASVTFILLWARQELSSRHPLVQLHLLRHRTVAITNLSGLLIAMSLYMYLPLQVDFVQTPSSEGYGLGVSVVLSGLMLLPFSAMSLVMTPVAAKVGARIGRSRVVPIGALLMATAAFFFAATGGAVWEGFVATGIAGIGVGFSFAAMPGLIVRSIPPHETGSALGFFQVVRTVGFALGSGVSGSILAAYTLAGHSLPSRAGFTVAMAVGGGVSVVAALVSSRLGHTRPAVHDRVFEPAIVTAEPISE